jgi:transaldolase
MERLVRLYEEFGQSPWLDNLTRGFLTSGQLAEWRDGGIRGLTSNPTIFQKAISGSADYDEQFSGIATDGGPVLDDYWTLRLRGLRSPLRAKRGRRWVRQRRGGSRAGPRRGRHRGRRTRAP